MKKAIRIIEDLALIGLAIVTVVMVVQFSKVPLKYNCEFCGEQFDTRHSTLDKMCDVCFGWNEHKAEMENGVQVNFSDGTGYYFEGNR